MIDHDYNYLTSLEREFDKADRDANARGFLLDEIGYQGRAARGKPLKGEVPMKEALERCGVIVARAPQGMSRAKANHTRWSKEKRRLTWTVEWVHPDGRKEERDCAEDCPFSDAYAAACNSKEGYVTRKKRKIAKEKSHVAQNISTAPFDSKHIPAGSNIREADQANHREPASSPVLTNGTKVENAETSSMEARAAVSQLSASESLDHSRKLLQNDSAPQEGPPTALQPPSLFGFYLHAPSLPSKETVLVPLEQSASFACSLRNRLVLEFPTIYVFTAGDRVPDCDHKVPEGFISEEDFFLRAKKLLVEEVEDGEISNMKGKNDGGERKNDVDVFGKDFDAERVLKVLGEDLESFG